MSLPRRVLGGGRADKRPVWGCHDPRCTGPFSGNLARADLRSSLCVLYNLRQQRPQGLHLSYRGTPPHRRRTHDNHCVRLLSFSFLSLPRLILHLAATPFTTGALRTGEFSNHSSAFRGALLSSESSTLGPFAAVADFGPQARLHRSCGVYRTSVLCAPSIARSSFRAQSGTIADAYRVYVVSSRKPFVPAAILLCSAIGFGAFLSLPLLALRSNSSPQASASEARRRSSCSTARWLVSRNGTGEVSPAATPL